MVNEYWLITTLIIKWPVFEHSLTEPYQNDKQTVVDFTAAKDEEVVVLTGTV